MKTVYTLPKEDLIRMLEQTKSVWEELRGKRIFLSGGTGFFGIWLLESFSFANETLGLGASLLALTRDLSRLFVRFPHFKNLSGVEFHEGDIRTFAFPEGAFSHVIHGATAAGSEILQIQPLDNLTTIIDGTRHILKFAEKAQTEKFLFVSSGAVYGNQPPDVSHVPETYLGAPDPLLAKSTYAEGKRLAEHWALLQGDSGKFEVKVARPFAFVGPYLPLDSYFAIGNFLRDALAKKSISISGDGTPFRSYLYAADLTVWLWEILISGKSGRAYNIGSEDAISLVDLAKLISQGPWLDHPVAVEVAKKAVSGAKATRYVPSTQRAQNELGLKQTYSLLESIQSTMNWNLQKRNF